MKPPRTDEIFRSAPARVLRRRVGGIRLRQFLVVAGTGLALTGCALAGWLLLGMLADWRLELPRAVRCVLLAVGTLGALTGFLVRFCQWPHDDRIALLIERRIPTFRGRFIAAIQLARSRQPGMSLALVRALIADAADIESQLDFKRVVSAVRLGRAWLALIGCAAAMAGLTVLTKPLGPVLIQRALLFETPLPRNTRLEVRPGDAAVAIGDELAIEVVASGVIPPTGTVTVKTASGVARDFPLDPDPARPALFRRVLQSVQESFTYTIRLNDGRAGPFRIEARPRPTVTALECEQVYPAYTRLGTVRRTAGDLRLLAGSELRLNITASVPVRLGTVRLAGTDREFPARIDRRDRRHLAAALPIPAKGATGFSIQLTDEHGILSQNGATHRFEIVPDRPPTVKLTAPDRQEELVTPRGALALAFEAVDDFGVARVTLHYAVLPETPGRAAGKTRECSVDLAPGENARSISRSFDWKIGSLDPRPAAGDAVEYWIEAADGNDVTGPGIGTTGHFRIKVVTPEEKKAEMAGRLMNTFQGLNDIADEQEKLHRDVGASLHEKKTP